MEIFCDESGGSDAANDVFLVAAVTISGASATRLLKSFRRATNWRATEVKGHTLPREQRRILFDLIHSEPDAVSVVVNCHRSDPVGGWAMGTLPEMTLYGRLLTEACETAAAFTDDALTITADAGRYKRRDLRTVEGEVLHAAGGWTTGRRRTSMSFRDSRSAPGLQIADVVANTALQSLGDAPAAAYAQGLLEPLERSGRLILRSIALAHCRPGWLTTT